MHCGYQSECSQLGYPKREGVGEGLLLDWKVPLCFSGWGPKDLAESANFQKEDICQHGAKQSLKEGRKPRTKAPRIQPPVSCILQHKCGLTALKKPRKARRRLQSMLNVWPREWRKPKKARSRWAILPELLRLSLGQSKVKSLPGANKSLGFGSSTPRKKKRQWI